ncbi:MAG: RIP metalloprotease RseP [Clostridiales bacterium]|jgi:regulator of sigma E protease|nr:RIP metalloprotease RseP [Clostridiales bacterium]
MSIGSIAIAVIVFGLIVVIHELGHFMAAKKSGVTVEEFAIGMGPVIWKKRGKETVYSLRLLPIGGFCKMLGEDAECKDDHAFNNKKVSSRAFILTAGAGMNFVLAYALFLVIVLFGFFRLPQVKAVIPGSPAEMAGLAEGDTIVKINNTTINIYEDLAFEMDGNRGEPITVEYMRGKERFFTVLSPFLDEASNGYKIGFNTTLKNGMLAKADPEYEKAGLLESLEKSFYLILFYIKATILSIVRLFTSQLSISDLSGPIGIVTTIGEVYTETISVNLKATILSMINLCGILSANLGVINLLPLPALDGGRLVFVMFEAIRKKPFPAEKEGMVHFIGFVLLMALAVFIAYSDIKKML